ncbi:MAG: MFS transporter [Dehalococcoidia bacterium]|nr:MFS transporter [Tepidiformaceae bacterium]
MFGKLAPLAVYSNIFLVMLGLGVIGPNLTDIRRDFDVSYGAISWGVSAFAFARFVTNLPAGIAAGRLPRVPLLMAGTFCVAAGGAAAALSNGLELFLVSRALQGVGSSISTTVGLTMVLDSAAPDRRGRASGTFHSALGGGALFGPGFGALLAEFGGWRAALGGTAVAATVSFALLALVLRYPAASPVAAPGSPEQAETVAARRPSILALVFGAGLAAYAAAFAIFFVRGGVQQTVVPLMGREEMGLSVASLSVLLMVSAALSTVLGPFVGGLSDRLGRERVLLPGLVLLGASTMLLTMANSTPLFVSGVLLTSLAGTTFSIPSSMIVDAVGASQRAAAIGVYRVVGDAAFTVAPFASGFLVDGYGFAAAGAASTAVIVAALAVGRAAASSQDRAVYSSEPADEPASAT